MPRRQIILLCCSIVIGILLVGGALYAKGVFTLGTTDYTAQRIEKDKRHLYGNPKAETVIVEFSDYECPFCAQLHPTLKKIVDQSNGTIAWEYRHLPLASHPHARLAASYAECVALESGTDTFWQYSDVLFANQEKITEKYLLQQALALGSEEKKLSECVQSNSVATQIANDTQVAKSLGGSGTPFSVIIFPDKVHKPISGALPYEKWVTLLDL